jgi:hypothetical protein
MNFKLQSFILLLLSGVVVLLFNTGCEPYRSLTFENQTSYPIQVNVFPRSLNSSDIPSFTWDSNNKEIIVDVEQSKKFVSTVRDEKEAKYNVKYAIVAINDKNEVVFSKFFTWNELYEMDWKVIIKTQQ